MKFSLIGSDHENSKNFMQQILSWSTVYRFLVQTAQHSKSDVDHKVEQSEIILIYGSGETLIRISKH